MTTIKSQTIEKIQKVLKQRKPYYRSNEFGFPTNRNGYSTHQGAVLRYYLRENGYVNVRVSEIDPRFFTDNQDQIRQGLIGEPISELFLKPSNTIIIKAIDYSFYMKDKISNNKKYFTVDKESANLKPVTLTNKPVVGLLLDKYTKKLKTISSYYELNKDDLPMHELTDLEMKMRDLAEVVNDLASIL